MTERTAYGDFGWQMNNALNRIANYAKEKGLSADDVVMMFDTAIAVRSVFLTHNLPYKGKESD